jgi:hypothetical protein
VNINLGLEKKSLSRAISLPIFLPFYGLLLQPPLKLERGPLSQHKQVQEMGLSILQVSFSQHLPSHERGAAKESIAVSDGVICYSSAFLFPEVREKVTMGKMVSFLATES